MLKYSVLISSCEKYSDCWEPMSILLEKYWQGIENIDVYIVTDTYNSDAYVRNYGTKVTDLIYKDIIVTNDARWGGRLRKALEQIKDDFIIFMLDDMWPDRNIDVQSVMNAVEYIMSDEAIGVIYLNKAERNVKKYTKNPVYSVQTFGTSYIVNTAPAIWSKNYLLSILKDEDSAWDFERIGSFREEVKEKTVLYSSHISYNVCDAPGAIKRGKWVRSINELCEKNQILIDFKNRGFMKTSDILIDKFKSVIFNMCPELIVKIQNRNYYRKTGA